MPPGIIVTCGEFILYISWTSELMTPDMCWSDKGSGLLSGTQTIDSKGF